MPYGNWGPLTKAPQVESFLDRVGQRALADNLLALTSGPPCGLNDNIPFLSSPLSLCGVQPDDSESAEASMQRCALFLPLPLLSSPPSLLSPSLLSLIPQPLGGAGRSAFKGLVQAGRRTVERLRQEKKTTGPLHREQYIGAYVEAQTNTSSSQALALPRAPSPFSSLLPQPLLCSSGPVAEFGSWRRSEAMLSGRLGRLNRLTHCVIREATTPPAWSAEALARQAPLHAGPWKALADAAAAADTGRGGAAAIGTSFQHLAATTAAPPEVLRAVACVLLQQFCWFHGWEAAVAFYERCVPLVKADRTGAAQLLAVLAEGIRYSQPVHGAPPWDRVVELAAAAAGPGASLLPPVTAAPLLAIAQPPDLAALEARLLGHLIPPRGPRRFLPGLAWAELIRAYSRAGAPETAIRQLVDDVTDPQQTLHAELLLRSPHVWAAYLEVSPGAHALEVYEANRRHYGVQDGPRLVAAVMKAVLGDESTPKELRLSKAEALWSALQRRGQEMIVFTTSAFESYAQLCVGKQDKAGLLALVSNYDDFFFYFGVPEQFWAEQHGGAALHRGADLAVEFLEQCSSSFPFHIPPAVTAAVRRAMEETETEARINDVGMTPDALADLLQCERGVVRVASFPTTPVIGYGHGREMLDAESMCRIVSCLPLNNYSRVILITQIASSTMSGDHDDRELYPMPEDPPQFGEDGLGFLNQSADPIPDDPDTVKKEPAAASVVSNDPFRPHKDLTEEEKERAELVWRRRHPSNPILKLFQLIIPYGGIISSGINLASSTLGAGIVALPCAFQLTGIIMAVLYLLIVASLTVYSITLLAIAGERTGLRSWSMITRQLLGRGGDYFLVFVMWFLCFGGDVSYIISLQAVFRAFLKNSASASDYIKSDSGVKLITSMVWLCIIFPLCLLREINSLRMVSFIAVFFIVFFVVALVVTSGRYLAENGPRDDLVLFQTGNLAISGLSLFMFGFVAQVNTFEIFREMYKPSVKRMFLSAVWGVGLCVTLYFFAGFFGYMEFGSTVTDSVLDKYNPIDDKLMGVSYAGIILKLSVGFALHLIPCRDAVYHVLGTNVRQVPFWKNALISGGSWPRRLALPPYPSVEEWAEDRAEQRHIFISPLQDMSRSKHHLFFSLLYIYIYICLSFPSCQVLYTTKWRRNEGAPSAPPPHHSKSEKATRLRLLPLDSSLTPVDEDSEGNGTGIITILARSSSSFYSSYTWSVHSSIPMGLTPLPLRCEPNDGARVLDTLPCPLSHTGTVIWLLFFCYGEL
eukprot:gene9463-6645_t